MICWFRMSSRRYPWKWESLYRVAQVSRQSVHKYEQQKQVKLVQLDRMIAIVEQTRQHHKKMGLKKIYVMQSDQIEVGRDIFLRMMVERGYGIRPKRSYHITTKSLKDKYFPNLIKGLRIRAANRVWQSDITYFKYRNKHLYLTLIVDVYTRYIVGYHLDNNMLTKTMINALKMAIRSEGITNQNQLIHHSDRGSQYGSAAYVSLLKSNDIQISMCLEAYENAYAERLNQTIKNEYLDFIRLDGSKKLTAQIKNQIRLYNEQRPHWNLPNYMSPMNFKIYIETIPEKNRPEMTLYTEVLDPQDQAKNPDPDFIQTEESALTDEMNHVYNLLNPVN